MPERVDKQINFVIIIFILLGSVAGIGWDGWAGSFGNRGGRVNRNRAFFIFLFYSLDHKQAMIRTEQILGLKELLGIYLFSCSKVRVNLKIHETKSKRPAT